MGDDEFNQETKGGLDEEYQEQQERKKRHRYIAIIFAAVILAGSLLFFDNMLNYFTSDKPKSMGRVDTEGARISRVTEDQWQAYALTVIQKLYDAMVLGSLVISDDPDNIIPYDKAQLCSKSAENITFIDKRIISIDVARSTTDETVIYGWGGSQVLKTYPYTSQDLDVTANRAVAMLKEIQANTIVWDADGLGGGLMSHLKHIVPQNTKLIEFHGNSPATSDLYFNARTEAYYETAGLIKDGMIAIPKDDALIGQLSTPRSFIQNGKLRVEDKEDLKKRLGGKSPDRADALVYGVWGLKRAPATTVRQIIRPGTYAEYIYKSEQRNMTTEDLDDVIGNDSVRHYH